MPYIETPESRAKSWPYHYETPEQAFDLEASVSGLHLQCVGCVEKLAPYEFGSTGRTSVHMSTLHEFMRGHIASEHPNWTVGS